MQRSFATARPKIPLQLHGIEGRYATALYSAAAQQDIRKAHADLLKLKQKIGADSKLSFVLTTPIFGKTIKQARIDTLVSANPVVPVVSNFLSVLAENGRLDLLDKILTSFESLMSAAAGEVTVTVTSAQELDKSTSSKLTSLLKGTKLIGSSQTPKVVSKVCMICINSG